MKGVNLERLYSRCSRLYYTPLNHWLQRVGWVWWQEEQVEYGGCVSQWNASVWYYHGSSVIIYLSNSTEGTSTASEVNIHVNYRYWVSDDSPLCVDSPVLTKVPLWWENIESSMVNARGSELTQFRFPMWKAGTSSLEPLLVPPWGGISKIPRTEIRTLWCRKPEVLTTRLSAHFWNYLLIPFFYELDSSKPFLDYEAKHWGIPQGCYPVLLRFDCENPNNKQGDK